MFCGEHGTVDHCPECIAEDNADYINFLEALVVDLSGLSTTTLRNNYKSATEIPKDKEN